MLLITKYICLNPLIMRIGFVGGNEITKQYYSAICNKSFVKEMHFVDQSIINARSIIKNLPLNYFENEIDLQPMTSKLATKRYNSKFYKTKNGESAVKKDIHADAIGAILRLPENDIESLTKANKNALKVIFEALANSKPI